MSLIPTSAIVGAGLIGAEVASAALELGARVTLIDPIDPPLVPAVGPELARRLHDMHATAEIDTIQGKCLAEALRDPPHLQQPLGHEVSP